MLRLVAASLFLLVNFSASKSQSYITTGNGVPLANKDDALTLGRHGPLLLDDIETIDELAKFATERIPSRIVHPSGTGAFGHFEVTNDITQYCAADLFSEVGKKTPIVGRFSTTSNDKGAPETLRDMRGITVKFYTKEGNWDILSLSLPVIGMRNPALFPSVTHALLPQPDTNVADINKLLDFATLRPELVHFFLNFISPVGIPDGYRHMNTFAISVFKLINAQGEVHYAKFSIATNQGVKNLNLSYAETLQVSSPKYFTQDLWNAIESGNYPSWTLRMQVLTETQFKNFPFDPLDNTKFWPEDIVPNVEIGILRFNRNPDNQFEEVEQAAYSPSHLVPGIRPSADKMLQARLFTYPETQRHRLGPNHLQLPINRPINPVRNYQRDGPMVFDNQGNATNYHPNSYDNYTTSERVKQLNPPYELCGVADRYDTSDEGNFFQAKEWFEETLTDDERTYIATVAAGILSQTNPEIRARTLELFGNVSETLPTLIEEAMAASS